MAQYKFDYYFYFFYFFCSTLGSIDSEDLKVKQIEEKARWLLLL